MTRTVKRDENAYARLGWLLVLFGFGGALLWAAFAPLDQGVAVPATVIISGQRKSVQHPLGGWSSTSWCATASMWRRASR